MADNRSTSRRPAIQAVVTAVFTGLALGSGACAVFDSLLTFGVWGAGGGWGACLGLLAFWIGSRNADRQGGSTPSQHSAGWLVPSAAWCWWALVAASPWCASWASDVWVWFTTDVSPQLAANRGANVAAMAVIVAIPAAMAGRVVHSVTGLLPIGSRARAGSLIGASAGAMGWFTSAGGMEWCGTWWPAIVCGGSLVLWQMAVGRGFSVSTSVSPAASPALEWSPEVYGIANRRSVLWWDEVVAAGGLGLSLAVVTVLLQQVWLWTAPLLVAMTAALVTGAALGRAGSPRYNRPKLAWFGVVVLSAVAAVGQGQLVELVLWQNSRLTDMTWLWVARAGLIAVLYGVAGATWSVLSFHPVDGTRSGFRLAAAACLGAIAGYAGLSQGFEPVLLLQGLVVLGTARWLVDACIQLGIGTPVTLLQRLVTVSGALAVTAVAFGVGLVAPWDAAGPARILFSTAAFQAARSGWTTQQLRALDDQQQLSGGTLVDGLTVWRQHADQFVVRRFGAPIGSASRSTDRYPEYPAELIHAAWPLVTVDQPARVLVAGLGAGTTLRSVLAFPVESVTLCETHPEIVELVTGRLAQEGLFNPLQDERVQWQRGAAAMLPGTSAAAFDVVLSSPPQLATIEAQAWFRTDHYARAASRLTAQGLFVQRLPIVDFGPDVLRSIVATARQAFPHVALLEVDAGELLLLGAHDAAAMMRADCADVLQRQHVQKLLSRCGWDWSRPLSMFAWEPAGLSALCDLNSNHQTLRQAQRLAWLAPRELHRWAPKWQETRLALQQPVAFDPALPVPKTPSPLQMKQPTNELAGNHSGSSLVNSEAGPDKPKPARVPMSQVITWLGAAGDQPELLRRLSELATQQRLIAQFPDRYWWEYRKSLKDQLQNHPRSAVLPINHVDRLEERWHPEDRQRRDYFEALGAASAAEKPSELQLARLEQLLEPHDPLLTFFGHQELADLYRRADIDPATELNHRLHVIHFSSPTDTSVRNVVTAIDLVTEQPAAVADPATRFHQLNGLLQVLRVRWENRRTRPGKSAQVTLQEVDRSLLAVERATLQLAELRVQAAVSEADWDARKSVIDRLLLRPFRSYREELVRHSQESRRRTQELLVQAAARDAKASPAATTTPNAAPKANEQQTQGAKARSVTEGGTEVVAPIQPTPPVSSKPAPLNASDAATPLVP
jgi:hypothetical protein